MKIFAQWLLVFALLAILLSYVSGQVADKQTGRLYARAHLSEVQNEGRKDMMAGLMPYVVISVSLIAGSIVTVTLTFGLVSLAALWMKGPAQPRIIETRSILILQPGEHSRREIFKLLSSDD